MIVALHTPATPTGEQIGPHEITVDGVLVGLTNDHGAAAWLHDECRRDTDLAATLRDQFAIDGGR